MKVEDKQAFLDDFRKADVPKKLDMWYFALDQEVLWEEILSEMSAIAQPRRPGQGMKKYEL